MRKAPPPACGSSSSPAASLPGMVAAVLLSSVQLTSESAEKNTAHAPPWAVRPKATLEVKAERTILLAAPCEERTDDSARVSGSVYFLSRAKRAAAAACVRPKRESDWRPPHQRGPARVEDVHGSA